MVAGLIGEAGPLALTLEQLHLKLEPDNVTILHQEMGEMIVEGLQQTQFHAVCLLEMGDGRSGIAGPGVLLVVIKHTGRGLDHVIIPALHLEEPFARVFQQIQKTAMSLDVQSMVGGLDGVPGPAALPLVALQCSPKLDPVTTQHLNMEEDTVLVRQRREFLAKFNLVLWWCMAIGLHGINGRHVQLLVEQPVGHAIEDVITLILLMVGLIALE